MAKKRARTRRLRNGVRSNKVVRELCRAARKQGAVVEFTRGGHLKMMHPDTPGVFVLLPSTPGENRALKNMKAEILRQLGLVL